MRRWIEVLGHKVSDDGGLAHEWAATKKCMWASFLGNIGSKRARELPVQQKLKLVTRAVQPQFEWKCSRWPYQKTIAIELENLQCQMIARCVKFERLPTETLDQYDRRRKRESRNIVCKHGSWAIRWAERVVNWHNHVLRAEARGFILPQLWRWHDRQWLMQQRPIL